MLCPGLGQLYNAELRKSVFLFSLAVIAGAIVVSVLLNPPSFHAFMALLFAILTGALLYLFGIVDAATTARRARLTQLSSFNRRWVYAAIAISWIAACQTLGLWQPEWRSYTVGNASMTPGLRPGEVVVTWRGYYTDHDAEPGDVVVFRSPEDDEDYIRRVVGLPGDLVQIRGGLLYINDEPVRRERVQSSASGDLPKSGKAFVETLPSGQQHQVVLTGNDELSGNTSVQLVPPRHYFLLADHLEPPQEQQGAGTADESKAVPGESPARETALVGAERLKDRVAFVLWAEDWRRIGMEIQ